MRHDTIFFYGPMLVFVHFYSIKKNTEKVIEVFSSSSFCLSFFIPLALFATKRSQMLSKAGPFLNVLIKLGEVGWVVASDPRFPGFVSRQQITFHFSVYCVRLSLFPRFPLSMLLFLNVCYSSFFLPSFIKLILKQLWLE